MDINSLGGAQNNPSIPQYDPQYLMMLSQEFKTEWQSFLENPSQENAEKLQEFLAKNKDALGALAKWIDLPPGPYQNWDKTFDALQRNLQSYAQTGDKADLMQSYEWLNDMRQWVGINFTPEQVKASFDQLIGIVEGGAPQPSLIQELSWMLNEPGYASALAALAKDKGAFEADSAAATKALADLQKDPGNPELQAAVKAACDKLQSDLG